ncbi:MAG: hypothetical protein ABSA13_18140 [Beijerinckiaceae bacterium]|jgi:predicted site-specific integrase-resolvase
MTNANDDTSGNPCSQGLHARGRLGTMEDVGTTFKVSISTVKNWRKASIIEPAIQLGNIIRFDLDDCARRLAAASQRKKARQPRRR